MESRALKYDLERHEMCVIGLPPSFQQRCGVLRTTEDGRLGFATIHQSKLYMWSRKDGPEVDTLWTQDRVIELEVPLRCSAILTSTDLVGFVDATGVIFLRADDVIFIVDLKNCNLKQVCKGIGQYAIVPYLSFYTPGTAFPGSIDFPVIFRMSNTLVAIMKSRLRDDEFMECHPI